MTYSEFRLLGDLLLRGGLTLAFRSAEERLTLRGLVSDGLAATDRRLILKRARITERGAVAFASLLDANPA